MTTATAKRKPAGDSATVKCAFCKGTGKDPYELMSKLSGCPVCNGHGTVEVEKPTVSCMSCRGTGKQRHTRLTCSACGGTGLISLTGPTKTCSQCGGSGRQPDSDLPCSHCRGAGLVAQKSSRAGRAKAKPPASKSK